MQKMTRTPKYKTYHPHATRREEFGAYEICQRCWIVQRGVFETEYVLVRPAEEIKQVDNLSAEQAVSMSQGSRKLTVKEAQRAYQLGEWTLHFRNSSTDLRRYQYRVGDFQRHHCDVQTTVEYDLCGFRIILWWNTEAQVVTTQIYSRTVACDWHGVSQPGIGTGKYKLQAHLDVEFRDWARVANTQSTTHDD